MTTFHYGGFYELVGSTCSWTNTVNGLTEEKRGEIIGFTTYQCWSNQSKVDIFIKINGEVVVMDLTSIKNIQLPNKGYHR